ncbi:hypothetical protein MTX78_21165 [Hymenobacter tibetensis]|uniref:DUF4890 domain-containing protein n=1 Tax=Hymenobacter tibetensis TaxID=497967 RepID=A0ABY4CWH2_9BACT|nr:hypothetical protein [Hymenobacter tibetensis]UOG74614.1 hypothetical protein MTX78_21165 [Hymenobacter tibetensis]
MLLSRSLLALCLLATLTVGCARRNKNIPTAKSTAAASATPAPIVAPTAARDFTDEVTEELKLRPDQQQRMRAILTSFSEQANAAQKQYGSNRTALTAELKRLNTASQKQLQEVLTPEQYKQLINKQRQKQAQAQSRRPTQ